MRLGGYQCKLSKGSISFDAYKKHGASKIVKDTIVERHRHRFEFNNEYREKLEGLGLVVAGINPSQKLVEIIEIKGHPFFVGTQFHPELQSRPLNPHPLFMRFIETAAKK